MSETIQYGAVGALIVASQPSGLVTVTRHLLVMESSGLAEIARSSLPQGHARIRAFLENRVSLPDAAESRMKRELARAASPITDQVAAGVGNAVKAKVGVARCQTLSNGVFLLAVFRGNLGQDDDPEADRRVGDDFKKMASALVESNIKALATSVSSQAKGSPAFHENLDLEERPCLESFGSLCHSIAKSSSLFEVSRASEVIKQAHGASTPRLGRP